VGKDKDAMSCPYAAAWAIYGFNQRPFNLEGSIIEPYEIK